MWAHMRKCLVKTTLKQLIPLFNLCPKNALYFGISTFFVCALTCDFFWVFHALVLCFRGIKQLIKDKGSKAALLLIHLCSIEVRMTLECDNQQQVRLLLFLWPKISILSSYLNVASQLLVPSIGNNNYNYIIHMVPSVLHLQYFLKR